MPDQSWQTLYREALAESDPNVLSRRIGAARHAIHKHLAEVEDSRDTRERQLLNTDFAGAKASRVKRRRKCL
jgi:hypothetical protein